MGAVALSGIHLHRRKLSAFSYDIITLLLVIGNDGRVTGLLVHGLALTEGDWVTRALTGVDGG